MHRLTKYAGSVLVSPDTSLRLREGGVTYQATTSTVKENIKKSRATVNTILVGQNELPPSLSNSHLALHVLFKHVRKSIHVFNVIERAVQEEPVVPNSNWRKVSVSLYSCSRLLTSYRHRS